MPSRVSSAPKPPGKPSTSTSRKVSNQSTTSSTSRSSKPSAVSRVSPLTVTLPDEGPESALRKGISTIFRDAQRSVASHRKLVINLRKIQETCYYESPHNTSDEFDENDFANEVTRCVLRIMPVKKSEGVGERVIRFLGLFLKHANEKDQALVPEDADETGIMVETGSTRLTAHIMSTIIPLLSSKEKFVRFRATQLISHLVNALDCMDDELFQMLRHGLLKRIRDKEAMVRVQAVLGLGRLVGIEGQGEVNSDDSDDDGAGLLEKLLDVLQNDPSADVRRSLLVNLPIVPNTLPYLLERARDQDPATRRALYSRLLPALGDFRHLSLSMREKLLRWGLRDRDENVRKAAGRLFRERWIEDCAGATPTTEGAPSKEVEAAPPNIDGLLELLERIDVVNSGVENGVALEAMRGFWEGRPDYRDMIEFNDHYWDTLSAESVFVVRSFNDFCHGQGTAKFNTLIEEKMPEVTKLAYYLQRYINVLVEALKRVATHEADEDEEEEETVEQEFIVEQMLHIAKTLDYSDEVGRRKMFALLRQSLAVADLPEEVTKLVVEVLRGICIGDAAGEREFVSVVLEAVADIHDTIMDDVADDASFHSARSEVSGASTPKQSSKDDGLTEEESQDKAIREIMVNMKCLHIVQCMLQNVEGNLQQNTDLVAMLNNLVVPAVRSHEAPVRERGLLCLGLCSLLDKSLAEENLTLFIHFFTKGHSSLQVTALQILTDILAQHGASLITSTPTIPKVYLKALKSNHKTPDVAAAATLAICKLMLGRIIADSDATNELLKTLIVTYFDPSTQSNPSIRQTLSYFLPVYAYCRAENQVRVQSVALDVLHALFNLKEGLEDEGDEDLEGDMVSLATIGAHLVDWTDPRKCYVSGSQMGLNDDKRVVGGDVHLDFAEGIMERLNGSANKEEKKLLVSLLTKLYISPTSSTAKLQTLYEELTIAIDDRMFADATSRNALLKAHVTVGKIVNSLSLSKEGEAERGDRRGSVASRISSIGGRNDERGSRQSSVASIITSEGRTQSRRTAREGSIASTTSRTSRISTTASSKHDENSIVEEDEGDSTIINNKHRPSSTRQSQQQRQRQQPKEEEEDDSDSDNTIIAQQLLQEQEASFVEDGSEANDTEDAAEKRPTSSSSVSTVLSVRMKDSTRITKEVEDSVLEELLSEEEEDEVL